MANGCCTGSLAAGAAAPAKPFSSFLEYRNPAAHCTCRPGGLTCSVKVMYNHVNPKNGEKAPLIDDKVYEVIMQVSRLHQYPALSARRLAKQKGHFFAAVVPACQRRRTSCTAAAATEHLRSVHRPLS